MKEDLEYIAYAGARLMMKSLIDDMEDSGAFPPEFTSNKIFESVLVRCHYLVMLNITRYLEWEVDDSYIFDMKLFKEGLAHYLLMERERIRGHRVSIEEMEEDKKRIANERKRRNP